MDRSEVVVVGGGFVGLVSAAALADAGAQVTVLEALEGPNPAFRGELIHPRGARDLAALDLLDPVVAAGGVRVRGFAVFGRPRAPEGVLLPYPESSGSGIGLDHGVLVDALRRAVACRPRVRLVRGMRVRDVLIEDGRVTGVRVDGGRDVRAALVVAADGRHSRTRKLLGIATTTELVSHSAALSVDESALVEPGHGHVFVDAPGPTLAYPCGEGRVRMCIDVPLEDAKGPERLRATLRARYVPSLPPALARAMSAALEGGAPLAGAANHAIYTEGCAVRGAALVGDAGGCSHPITAAGMTNGTHDARTLAACVGRRGLTDEALLEYQRSRYRYIRTREAFTRALYDVLLGATSGPQALRDGMFAYWVRSERARVTSMAVLCGDDDRVSTFVGEYLRVVGTASAIVASARLAKGDFTGAGRELRAVGTAASGAIRVAIDKGRSALALERSAAVASPAPSAIGGRLHGGPGERGAQDADDRALDPRMAVHRGDSIQQP